jgi:hypothetical protein
MLQARFSASAGFAPVCGNLFHYAIEMYLKGHLSYKGLPELKKLGHQLQEIWNCFKLDVGDVALDCFDQVISELHKFESIRYPDGILSDGMMASISMKKQDPTLSRSTPRRRERVYEIIVEEIDNLVKVIFQKSSVNPLFFTNSLNSEAKKYLN